MKLTPLSPLFELSPAAFQLARQVPCTSRPHRLSSASYRFDSQPYPPRQKSSCTLAERTRCFAAERDLALAACIERHRASGKIGLGLVQGFAFQRHGALGSSVAHDSHNLIIAGTNPEDMLVCIEALARSGGGFVAAAGGQVLAELPLSVAGLMSTADVHTVRRQLQQLHAAARTLGCPLPSPFAALSFLPLPVIPELRVTPRGLFDVGKQQFVVIQ